MQFQTYQLKGDQIGQKFGNFNANTHEFPNKPITR